MSKSHFIWTIIKTSPIIFWAEIAWLKRYSRHPEKTPIEIRYNKVRKLIVRLMKSFKIDIKVNNSNYLYNQKSSFLAISNHRNFIDPMFYIYLSERPISFVGKKEVFDIPFVSQVLKAIDGYPIDREDMMSQVRLFKNIAERLKKNDLSYLIFAEGTRMKNPDQIQTLPYKAGSLKPAYWSEKNIIFAATYGTEAILGKKKKGYKKRNVTFEFHLPLKYEEFKNKSTTELMPYIEKTTNKTLIKIAKENNERNLK